MTPTKILLATDLTCHCDRALDRTVELAQEWGARVVVVHALESPLPVVDAPSWRRPVHPRDLVERRIRADLQGTAITVELVTERAEPADLILDTAERLECGLIVTGTARNETFLRSILGTTVEAVARRSRVPVLVVKSRPREPYRKMVLATDFSESSRAALETALALFANAQVSLCHAYDVPYESYLHDKMEAREQFANDARRQCQTFLTSVPAVGARHVPIHCEYGNPAEVLRELVEALDVDLVVAGTQGRSMAATFILGSVAQSLLSSVPRDVLIVRRR